jgi:tRNA G18 (ribose-2'-O)-methylase SpoU
VIHHVENLDDPRLAAYRHVGDPTWLSGHDLFVAEGRLVVRRLLAPSSRFRAVSILVTHPAFQALEDALPADCDTYVCSQADVIALTGYNFHRGCLALGSRAATPPPSPDTFAGSLLLIALEGIGNPDNIGGIFRSAAALGAGGVLMDPTCGDPLYRKAIRTSMGSVLRLPFWRVEDWPLALDVWRGRGFQVVALTPDFGAIPLDAFTRDRVHERRVMLLAGAEGPGLTPAALEQADARVRIPIDPEIDSLNVVVATAIALHALRHA